MYVYIIDDVYDTLIFINIRLDISHSNDCLPRAGKSAIYSQIMLIKPIFKLS